VDDWLEGGLQGRSERTRSIYREALKPLLEHIGTRPLREPAWLRTDGSASPTPSQGPPPECLPGHLTFGDNARLPGNKDATAQHRTAGSAFLDSDATHTCHRAQARRAGAAAGRREREQERPAR